jgi:hypothetical protein
VLEPCWMRIRKENELVHKGKVKEAKRLVDSIVFEEVEFGTASFIHGRRLEKAFGARF